jgi:hypothetical protein
MVWIISATNFYNLENAIVNTVGLEVVTKYSGHQHMFLKVPVPQYETCS